MAARRGKPEAAAERTCSKIEYYKPHGRWICKRDPVKSVNQAFYTDNRPKVGNIDPRPLVGALAYK